MVIRSSIAIQGSVGRGGRNLAADVATVQKRLNELMGKSRKPLAVDGLSGPRTKGMIADFQRGVLGFRWPDARVDPAGRTIRALNDPGSEKTWQASPPAAGTGRRHSVNLHFRSISLTNVPFHDQFRAAVDVYAQYDIDVRFLSGRSEWLSEADRKKFDRVDTSCVAGKDEWDALQGLLRDVPRSDVCVFFVGQLWDPKEKPGQEMFLGCGAYRPGSPACAVAANAGKYDMAHEVGHVLGLGHDNALGNLMHPTQALYPKLPVLTQTQVSKVIKSPLCH